MAIVFDTNKSFVTFVKTNGVSGEGKIIYNMNNTDAKSLTVLFSRKYGSGVYFIENDVDHIYGKIVVKNKNVSCWRSDKEEHDELFKFIVKYIETIVNL